MEQWVEFFTLLDRNKYSQAELVKACTGKKINLEKCKGKKRLKKHRTNDADGDDDSEDNIFSNNNPKGMPSQASNEQISDDSEKHDCQNEKEESWPIVSLDHTKMLNENLVDGRVYKCRPDYHYHKCLLSAFVFHCGFPSLSLETKTEEFLMQCAQSLQQSLNKSRRDSIDLARIAFVYVTNAQQFTVPPNFTVVSINLKDSDPRWYQGKSNGKIAAINSQIAVFSCRKNVEATFSTKTSPCRTVLFYYFLQNFFLETPLQVAFGDSDSEFLLTDAQKKWIEEVANDFSKSGIRMPTKKCLFPNYGDLSIYTSPESMKDPDFSLRHAVSIYLENLNVKNPQSTARLLDREEYHASKFKDLKILSLCFD